MPTALSAMKAPMRIRSPFTGPSSWSASVESRRAGNGLPGRRASEPAAEPTSEPAAQTTDEVVEQPAEAARVGRGVTVAGARPTARRVEQAQHVLQQSGDVETVALAARQRVED